MDKTQERRRNGIRALAVRVPSGFAVFLLSFGSVFAGGWILFAATLVCAIICFVEFYRAFRIKGHQPVTAAGMLMGVLFLVDVQINVPLSLLALVIAALGFIVVPLLMRRRVMDWAITLLGALYIGLFLSFALLIRSLPRGFEWLFTVFIASGAAATFAYLVGVSIGQHKLVPRISPGKTWEGFFGGALGCIAAAVLLGWIFQLLPWWAMLVFGAVLSISELCGDLWASVVKRYAGVKDYSNLIPGHGGLLDRFDGLILTLPVAYFLILLLGG